MIKLNPNQIEYDIIPNKTCFIVFKVMNLFECNPNPNEYLKKSQIFYNARQ